MTYNMQSVEPLVDIRDIHIDPNLPKEQRIREYVRQIRNPYCFKCGTFTIHARFAKDGPTLEECLKQILS